MSMKYVVVVTIDEANLDGDESIESACRLLNEAFGAEGAGEYEWTLNGQVLQVSFQPLSEVLSC